MLADGYHVFLSHDPFAETTMMHIKTTLTTLVPSCTVFLLKDDLKDASLLEAHVRESDVFVAMITDTYLAAAHCRRELVAAIEAKKPMLLLLDSGPRSGSGCVTVHELRAQLDRLDRSGNCSKEQHNASERLIAMLEDGSSEHMKKKDLDDVLKEVSSCSSPHDAA